MKAHKTVIAAAVATLLAGPALAQMDMSGQGKPQAGGMDHGAMSMAKPASKDATGTGTVKKIDAAKRTVNLSHGPIPAINWPAMTMDFQVAPGVDLSGVKAGQSVVFTLAEAGGGTYTVTSITPSK